MRAAVTTRVPLPGRGGLMDEPSRAEVPRAALTAADHVFGDAHAKLVLLEYGDYECPACIKAQPVLEKLLARNPGRLCLVYRHFPMMELHPMAESAAEAAEAAAAQGCFWQMHRLLFAQVHRLTSGALITYAQSLGLDMNRFNAEMGDHIYRQRVQEHRRAGLRSGLRTTPAIFLNNQPVDVSQGFDKLEAAVQSVLTLA